MKGNLKVRIKLRETMGTLSVYVWIRTWIGLRYLVDVVILRTLAMLGLSLLMFAEILRWDVKQ